jgi:group I intron endonuclease
VPLGFIYQIENIKNGKIYIGQTRNPTIRWQNHCSLLRNDKHDNSHLQNAWNIYGAENFKFSIIKEVPLEQLNHHEIQVIETFSKDKVYNTYKGTYTYGMTDSQKKNISEKMKNKTSWNKGIPRTERTKNKISESLKGKCFLTTEGRSRISTSTSHRNKNMTAEEHRKLSQRNHGRKLTEEQVNEIRQNKHLSRLELSLMYNVSKSTIKKIQLGYSWKFSSHQMENN